MRCNKGGEDILQPHFYLFKKVQEEKREKRDKGFAICICKSCCDSPRQEETLTLNSYLFSKLATDMRARTFK